LPQKPNVSSFTQVLDITFILLPFHNSNSESKSKFNLIISSTKNQPDRIIDFSIPNGNIAMATQFKTLPMILQFFSTAKAVQVCARFYSIVIGSKLNQ